MTRYYSTFVSFFVFGWLFTTVVAGECSCGLSCEAFLGECGSAEKALRMAVDSSRSALADRLLGSVMEEVVPLDLAASTGRPQKANAKGVVDPLELFRELADALVCRRCGQRMALPAEGGNTALPQLRDAVLTHAKDSVLTQGKPGQMVRGRLAACCMVFPLLLTPDADWSSDTTGSLPAWLRSGPWLSECERFALHAGRPLTAIRLSGTLSSSANIAPKAAVSYLQEAAGRMAKERDYAAELACLQAGVALARKHGDAEGIGAVAFLTAERMAAYGDPTQAAAFLKQIVGAKPVPDDIGRLQILRLTCLYKAEQYQAVADEANLCLAEDRHPRRRVQILYLAWAACRRVGEQEKATALGARFLKSYPTHSLAADMLYANAMGLLPKPNTKRRTPSCPGSLASSPSRALARGWRSSSSGLRP